MKQNTVNVMYGKNKKKREKREEGKTAWRLIDHAGLVARSSLIYYENNNIGRYALFALPAADDKDSRGISLRGRYHNGSLLTRHYSNISTTWNCRRTHVRTKIGSLPSLIVRPSDVRGFWMLVRKRETTKMIISACLQHSPRNRSLHA